MLMKFPCCSHNTLIGLEALAARSKMFGDSELATPRMNSGKCIIPSVIYQKANPMLSSTVKHERRPSSVSSVELLDIDPY